MLGDKTVGDKMVESKTPTIVSIAKLLRGLFHEQNLHSFSPAANWTTIIISSKFGSLRP